MVHGLGFGDEGPAELVVASHLLDDLIAEVLLADERVVGAVVIVGDGDGDAFGIAVRVPEATMLYHEYSGGMNTMPNRITHAAGTLNRRRKSRLRTLKILPTDTSGAWCCLVATFSVAIR